MKFIKLSGLCAALLTLFSCIVYDTLKTRLVNREFCALDDIADLQDGVFTLYYRSTSDKNSTLKFIVMDNFGQTRELQIEFENEI